MIFKQSIEGMSLQISRGRVLEPDGTANAEVRAHQVQVSNGKCEEASAAGAERGKQNAVCAKIREVMMG